MTMNPATRVTQQESFSSQFGALFSNAAQLAQAHGEQIKSELQSNARKTVTAIVTIILGALLSVIGILFGLVALVELLQSQLHLSPTASWAIVAVGILVAGLTISLIALKSLRSVNLVPAKSLSSVQESLKWITQR